MASAKKEIVDKNYDADLEADLDLGLDIDIDKDVDKDYELDASADIEYEEDVDVSHTNTNIDAHIKGIGFAYLEDINVDVDKDYETKVEFASDVEYDYDYDFDKDVDIDFDRDVDIDESYSTTINNETWNVTVEVHADSIIDHSHIDEEFDNDLNDIDNEELINVKNAEIKMDDFTSDQLAIAESFNGVGNDMQFDVNQSNELVDRDEVHNTTVSYENHQAPDADLTVGYASKAEGSVFAGGHAGVHAEGEYVEDGVTYTDYKYGLKDDSTTYYDKYGNAKFGGYASHVFGAEAATASALYVDLSLTAPENAFQTVEAEGGHASSEDGIDHANITDADGDVVGSTLASGDATASAEAFTSTITAGGNQQANFADLNIVGGNQDVVGDVGKLYPDAPAPHAADAANGSDDTGYTGDKSGLAIKGSDIKLDSDNDINDLDTDDLINVEHGTLTMDDFDLDITAIAASFNGPGNDMQFDVNQTNDLVDNDAVTGTNVTYNGSLWNGPFQDVSAEGGSGHAGDGINNLTSMGTDGIAGSAAATADAAASAEAFTSGIVVGANLQLNNFSATVVGGNSLTADDIDG